MFHGSGWWSYIYDAGEKPRVTWQLLRRVLAYARPYRVHIALMLLLILVTTLLGLLTPLIFRDLIDYTLPNGDVARLNLLAFGIVAIPLVSSLIGIVSRRLNAAVGEGVIYDLRVSLYAHLQQMSLRFFTNTKTGELMSRLNSDVVDAQNAISNTIVSIIANIIQVIFTLAFMLALEWRLTIIGIAVLPLFILVARRIGSRLRDIAREQMRINAQMNAMMNETLNISGVLLVKLFGQSNNEIQRFENRAGRVRDIGVIRAVLGNQFFAFIGLLGVVGTAIVYWFGGHLVIQGVFSIGLIVAFASYLGQLYGPLQALTNAPVDFATALVSFERVFEIIDLPLEIAESPTARALPQVRGELAFENVSFTYSVDDRLLLKAVDRYWDEDNISAALSGEDGKPAAGDANGSEGDDEGGDRSRSQARAQALQNVSFRTAPGQLVALVGPSGAGKTTMTYLIPRLYDPTEGRITLDGYDLRELKLDTLASAIGMVTQETHLFHDTIRTNLLYARPDATQEELEAACKAANIHDFISELPERYDTVVGERGYRLSGGEKQRVAIARVILKNPRILVLDEATSHLDSQSEALIQDALKTVMHTRTSIVIAHRLSTILAADLILVVDRGQVVERGTHDELLAEQGLYAHLYETQFRRERELL